MNELFLGVDIGSYQSKGAVVRASGAVVAQATRSHQMIVPQQGWAEHRAQEDWWGDFVAICQSLLAHPDVEPTQIASVGCSGIGPCVLPVDAAGDPLINAILYGVDTRAMHEVSDLTEQLGEPEIISRCGSALSAQSAGAKILWLRRNHSEIFARTHKVLNSSSFLVHRLTGKFAIDHYTAGAFSPLYSILDQDWDVGFSGIIDREMLPDLHWSTGVVGGVSAAAAEVTGIPSGTPVIAGTTDAAAEAASVGVREDGDLMIMYGSSNFMIMVSKSSVADAKLWHAPWLSPGLESNASSVATAGTLTHWFRRTLARELDEEVAFSSITREAAGSPPGARGLICLPYFSGVLTPLFDPNAKGAILGMDLTHTRADLARAMYEGIAFATRHVLATYESAGLAPRRIIAVGGGTKSPVWLHAVSDISGRTQYLRQQSIGACYGDALLAAVGVGAVEPGAIESWNPITGQIDPDESLAELFDQKFGLFRRWYERTKDLMP